MPFQPSWPLFQTALIHLPKMILESLLETTLQASQRLWEELLKKAIREALRANIRTELTQIEGEVRRVVEDSILREMNTVIPAKTQIRFDLRIICNFWEKIYILLDNNLADKSILSEAFRDLYQQKYYQVCTKFLVYLSSREGEPNTAMSTHLNNLRNNETWQ
ncbi:hypothetical protein H6F92_09280 [Microcystis wesenbergii FACHB-1317]|uniref:DUF4760 domain-containing protein n=1 Tax=Microcystis aeruginosa TaxID=1126 RepID=UPI000E3A1687|nr:hypothetical protein [Microcystis aeruginosa]MBD2288987.1 hypothetical protein [Microcystis wesenbergii FACHB-1317]REJ46182.1 MAG: hypothetical protein DWQ58_21790 [Microcystis aeruginosa TA09]UZO75761.1 hypothetical protein M8120_24065 [Microcystis aeruginosa str. Chao 1910]